MYHDWSTEAVELIKNIHVPVFEKIDSEISGIFNKNQEKWRKI